MSDTAVWKFTLPIEDTAVIDMPTGAEVLSVAAQHGDLQLWARVSTHARPEPRTFHVRGTGHPLLDAATGRFIGTVQMRNGTLVWHIFEATA